MIELTTWGLSLSSARSDLRPRISSKLSPDRIFFLDGYTLVIPVAKVHTNDSEDLISKINKLGVLAYRADNPAS